MNRQIHLFALGVVPLIAACASDMSLKAGAEDYADTGSSEGEGEGEAEDEGDGFSDTADDGLGSETEDDYLKLTPAATDAYVFVANPTRDTVTRISVPSLAVITTEVGVDPEVVATTSDYARAVTFNQGSDSVTLIDAETLATTEVSVRPDFNAMVMSPDGIWVVCYHDLAAEDEDDPDGGVASYNEVSVVNTVTGVHTPMVVGFNPREVKFTQDDRTAVIVSDAYLAVVDLTAATLSPVRIPLSEDTTDAPEAEEVVLDPDGEYAFVRQYGVEALLVVGLKDESVAPVAVGANPTDLDLTADGLHAVAVARGANQVWIYDMADPFATAEVLDLPFGEVLGSVLMSPDNSRALLYSTASGESKITEWDMDDDSFTVHGLEKPVSSVAITPNGGAALIFHDKANPDDIDEDSVLLDHYGLTLIDLVDFFPSPLRLPAEPTAYANAEDGLTGYFIMEGQPYLEVLDYESLLYTEVELKSDPVYVGVLSESRLAYVNQEHDLGRLSFYDPDADELQTITGFELNAEIEH